MHCLAFVQEAPGDPEIAILKLSDREHKDFHTRRQDFVNENRVFRKDVSGVEIHPESHPEVKTKLHPKRGSDSWLAVVIHYPHCNCVATCAPSIDPSV